VISQCINSIKEIAANFVKAKSSPCALKITLEIPRSSAIKLNVDAAFNLENGTGASGVILRNNQGGFIAVESTFIQHIASANMAEAMAMLHGLSLANRLGYTKIEGLNQTPLK
jgi:hypothetical protein